MEFIEISVNNEPILIAISEIYRVDQSVEPDDDGSPRVWVKQAALESESLLIQEDSDHFIDRLQEPTSWRL